MKKRNILITNDDGITSDGIVRLAQAATKFGEVWVVAPKHQCSAMSHRITLHAPMELEKVDFPVEGVHAYATDGTPADCVRFGLLNIVKGKTDVVFSGINYGYNCGSDVQYSATIGAALEAATAGTAAVAFSEGADGGHEVTNTYLEEMMREALAEIETQPLAFNQIININFPSCPISEYKGILRNRVMARNAFYIDRYQLEPNGQNKWTITLDATYHEDAAEGTDFRAIVDGYISIGRVQNVHTPQEKQGIVNQEIKKQKLQTRN